MTKSKLKPCPFCGATPCYNKSFPDTELSCPQCKQVTVKAAWYGNDLGLVEACWNKRAPSQLLTFVANSLKAIHDNAWHYEEGYDETDMCKTNIRALKAAGVAEYCGKWDMEEEDDTTGTTETPEES